MARPDQSLLKWLPTELLLIIIRFSYEPVALTQRGAEETSPSSYSIRHIRSLSLVSWGLRQLCLPFLFSSLKFTDAQHQELWLLEAKCTEDPTFAGFVRRLNLADIYEPCEILPSLVARLNSLQWLDLDADLIDGNLLATVNLHPTLETVAVCDTDLHTLATLVSSTSLPFSKILIYSAKIYYSLTLESPALYSVMSRRPRLAHLIVRGEHNIKAGPGALSMLGLEILDIGVYSQPHSPMSWLPAFVSRHERLHTITFSGHSDASWRHNPDILFPSQFGDAVESECLGRSVVLNAFSISRTALSSSIDDWQVVELAININKALGLSGLRIASSLAPHLTSVSIGMDRSSPIPVDDLVSALCCFPALRNLDLRSVYYRLRFAANAPWALPSSNTGPMISECMIADAAFRWIAARVAERTATLDLLHLTERGYEGEGRLRHLWRLNATYRVQRKPNGIEFIGTPTFVMADRFASHVLPVE
ncbi:hypothetical protein B0H15DRAFT_273511 [Mycena belliarum]|uniref:F-box domain-containing protein n=1 Tax=Mycena belliarum TaxID=1033014 RepID=A0AAD6U9L6_9AGAR|nr:hypothetical protein B0H15DRAFT_273511 [Mycena belliae]